MRIDQNDPLEIQRPAPDAPAPAPQRPRPPTVAGSPVDSLELSERARELRWAKKVVAETPDVREELVNRLKLRIRNNAFNVDSEALARRLLEGD